MGEVAQAIWQPGQGAAAGIAATAEAAAHPGSRCRHHMATPGPSLHQVDWLTLAAHDTRSLAARLVLGIYFMMSIIIVSSLLVGVMGWKGLHHCVAACVPS